MTLAFAPVRIVKPAVTPVSLEQVKARLRIDHADEDADLTMLLDMAVGVLDGSTGLLGRCLIQQTWRCDFERFPAGDVIRLPFDPVMSVTGITYVDATGADQALASNVYDLVTLKSGPAIRLRSTAAWPVTGSKAVNVSITFVAGYGPAGTDVPAPLCHAILTMVADAYAQRESFSRGGAVAPPSMVPPQAILMAFKRHFVSQV